MRRKGDEEREVRGRRGGRGEQMSGFPF